MAELKRADSDKRALPLMAKAQEEGQSLTIEQLCGVILNILVAGYDTTAFSLEILMLELAKNPKVSRFCNLMKLKHLLGVVTNGRLHQSGQA